MMNVGPDSNEQPDLEAKFREWCVSVVGKNPGSNGNYAGMFLDRDENPVKLIRGGLRDDFLKRLREKIRGFYRDPIGVKASVRNPSA